MNFEEKIESVRTVHDGVITKYQLAEVTLPNGKPAQREIVRHHDAAAIIAFTEEKELIVVRQYRVAIGQTTLELPAGLKDPEDQDTLVTAKREFEEETGLQADNWKYVTSMYSSPGFTDEYLEIYEAKGLKKVDEPLAQDEDEFLELITLSYEEALEAHLKGELCDAKTVFALFYWQLQRQKTE